MKAEISESEILIRERAASRLFVLRTPLRSDVLVSRVLHLQLMDGL
jgi:hypothetical protein